MKIILRSPFPFPAGIDINKALLPTRSQWELGEDHYIVYTWDKDMYSWVKERDGFLRVHQTDAIFMDGGFTICLLNEADKEYLRKEGIRFEKYNEQVEDICSERFPLRLINDSPLPMSRFKYSTLSPHHRKNKHLSSKEFRKKLMKSKTV